MGQSIIFTVDLEDWFTDGRQNRISSWNNYELRIEANVRTILTLLAKYNAKGTFFVLGWIALKKPDLIREIHALGHEIASHGFAHELVYTLTFDQFRNDVRKSKDILEDIVGTRVIGYRAPCFSMIKWGLEILKQEGFKYDSSIIPNTFHDLYAKLYSRLDKACFEIQENFWEVSLPVLQMGPVNIPWGGGGYLRFYPYSLFKQGINKIVESKGLYNFYIHPYDLDNSQPRLADLSLLNKLRRYYGLKFTEGKLDKLLNDFECKSITAYYPFLSTLK
ncbi:polysaccharide deacetylase family protein [Paenibacillus eucommiae]|uniref:Polysaccharide deacetylase family protein (PEP-CTERM system associated) n=1 Tax=Paenibacillus eucommiae TaxID=1355755 RepID=A0ABS4ISG1_9BACL|nr:polysaccharide deacetylase family protein [Paenibacillus eucommiae]MBP1990512.1 polysaccharide deacetylase family protein (PEP-CTERM system associated) [Paenibacillus eucommiae]